ncbi:MAG TPA: YceI family protein [Longimicrobium sp.]|uniref:YceI family protein n=1 Tax=Longimicrobium sp. TaxID=2029185 RepID=UPI002ED87E67
MRTRICLAGMIALPALLAAALPLSFQSGSRVWVSGTSTVRGYRCESTQVTGTAQGEGTELTQVAQSRGEISIPVASLDCRNGTMNGHMRNALKATENPTIRFRATSVAVTPEGAVRMTGPLTIAGQSREVTINGTAARQNGRLRVTGSKQLTMTDFGVQPPRLMAGTMRVHAPVTIGFDVVLGQ